MSTAWADLPRPSSAPKGVSEITLDRIIGILEESPHDRMSASDIARSTGMSAVTARRYLRFLAEVGKVDVSCQYGKTGAPTRLYRLTRLSTTEKMP
jgi:response regulator of citrate/malate metabolism